MNPIVIGSVGVSFLLAAFGLNLLKILSERSPWYLIMNIIGALLAAWYAFDGGIIPFVILELVWATVAVFQLGAVIKKKALTRGKSLNQ